MFSDSLANWYPFTPLPKPDPQQSASNDDTVDCHASLELPEAISDKAFCLMEEVNHWNCLVPCAKSIDDFISRFYERFHQIDKIATKVRFIEGHFRPFHLHSYARLKKGGWISHSTNISLLCHTELALERNEGIWHFNVRQEIDHHLPKMRLVIESSYNVDAFDNCRSKSEMARTIDHTNFNQKQLIDWLAAMPEEADHLRRREIAKPSRKLKVKNIGK